MASYGKNSQYARGRKSAIKTGDSTPSTIMATKIMPRLPVNDKYFGQTAPQGERMTTAYARGYASGIAAKKSGTTGSMPKGGSRAHKIAVARKANPLAKAITANRKAGVTAASAAAMKAKKKKAAARMEGQAYGAAFSAIPKKKGK